MNERVRRERARADNVSATFAIADRARGRLRVRNIVRTSACDYVVDLARNGPNW